MSSGPRRQREKNYERMKRKLFRLSPITEHGLALKRAATEVLEGKPIGLEEEGDQVGQSITIILQPPQTDCKTEFFIQPIFPVSIVGDVAEFYSLLEVPAFVLHNVDEDVKAYSVAMANIWLAYTYKSILQNVNNVLEMYKRTRTFGTSTVSLELPFSPSTLMPAANSRDGNEDKIEVGIGEVPVATNAGNVRSHHVSFVAGAESNGASNAQGVMERSGSNLPGGWRPNNFGPLTKKAILPTKGTIIVTRRRRPPV